MTVEQLCWGGGGGGVSHPLQLNTGLVVNSFIITNSHLGRRAYAFYSKGKYSVGTNEEQLLYVSYEKPLITTLQSRAIHWESGVLGGEKQRHLPPLTN